jgi:hypothetical protein
VNKGPSPLFSLWSVQCNCQVPMSVEWINSSDGGIELQAVFTLIKAHDNYGGFSGRKQTYAGEGTWLWLGGAVPSQDKGRS